MTRIAVLREAPAGAVCVAGKRGPVRESRALIEVDELRVDAGRGRVTIRTARPRVLRAYGEALGRKLAGDARALFACPSVMLKWLLVGGRRALGKAALSAAAGAARDGCDVRVVALQIDTGRGERVEVRGDDALTLGSRLAKGGGYFTRATLRFRVDGERRPVDAFIELPNRLSISDARHEPSVRAALDTLGVFAPGAVADDLTTLAPWVHAEWRWREVLGDAVFDVLAKLGVLARAPVGDRAHLADAAFRRFAASFRTFAFGDGADRGMQYAIADDGTVASFTVARATLATYRLDTTKLRATLCARLGAQSPSAAGGADAKARLPRGLFDIGEIALRSGALRFVLLARAVEPSEARGVARAVRRALSGRMPVMLVPEGRSLGGILPEVSLTLAEQLGAADLTRVLRRAAEEVGVDLALDPRALAAAYGDARVVVSRDRPLLIVDGVEVVLPESPWKLALVLAEARGSFVRTADIDAALSSKRTSDGATRHAKMRLDKAVRAAFAEAKRELPGDWAAMFAYVKGKRWRLAVAAIVV